MRTVTPSSSSASDLSLSVDFVVLLDLDLLVLEEVFFAEEEVVLFFGVDFFGELFTFEVVRVVLRDEVRGLDELEDDFLAVEDVLAAGAVATVPFAVGEVAVRA